MQHSMSDMGGMNSNDELMPLKTDANGWMRYTIACLIDSVAHAHLMHLNSRSYAEHKALEKYYTEMPELVDVLAETFIGLTGEQIKNHHNEYTDVEHMLTEVYGHVMTAHALPAIPTLSNPLESVLTFMQQIRYLLTLK